MTGRVIKAFGRYYTIRDGGRDITSVLRGRIKRDERLRSFSEPVAVGDIVDYHAGDDGSGVIERIHERRNVFTRKDRSSRREDLIAANIDQILVIQSFREPAFNLRFVDRILVRGEKEGIPVVLCLNKTDLAGEEDHAFVEQYYRSADISIVKVSALKKEGLEALKDIIRGRISILVGYSGVGKSSILNSIQPGLSLRISHVSESTRKGRHTTTNVEYVDIDENTALIDTPGVREFGLLDIEPAALCAFFTDFRQYNGQCRFSPCSHDHEPGCMVKRQVEEGGISPDRYESYLNILYSIREYYDNMY
jgi:ribosome biogenesis GTPase